MTEMRTTEYVESKHAPVDDLDPLTLLLIKEEYERTVRANIFRRLYFGRTDEE
jgi:hypothetical protein